MPPRDIGALWEMALRIRRHVVRMLAEAGSGHLGGCMSCADILATLYGAVLRNVEALARGKNPAEDHDHFVLSIGHVAPAYYAALAERLDADRDELLTLRRPGSKYPGHPPGAWKGLIPGHEIGSGSLGQGLSVGLGMALGERIRGRESRIFVLMGDGELQEGQIWEAAMAAAHHRAGNLIGIVDWNGVQIDGPTREVMSLDDLPAKWAAFGWRVLEVDGHDMASLLGALSRSEPPRGIPTVVLARTLMGCGIAPIEGDYEWHGRAPRGPEEREAFLRELEISHAGRLRGDTLHACKGVGDYVRKRGGLIV